MELYIDCDGSRVHAKLDLPKEKEKMPVLIIFPGVTGHIEERHIIAAAETAVECGYAALRTELYGHGLSDGEFRKHTVLIWLNQAMRVIDYALGLPFCSEVWVSGHSQGGLTAFLAAGMMADRVAGAIPLSPAVNIRDGAVRGSLFGIRFDPEHVPETFPCGPGIDGNYLRAAKLLPVEAAAAQLKKPVLIIHGTADETVPYEDALRLKERLVNAELIPIEGDDHCYDLHLDLVQSALKAFLEKMADRTADRRGCRPQTKEE